ncbi:MAG: ABC transporter permease [Hyphomicrobiaceae bacterium]
MLRLERRSEQSWWTALASPAIALFLTLLTGFLLLLALGKDPAAGLYYLFLEPVTVAWSLEEVLVKATPLALIAAGLALCFKANVWNIGAEGQFIVGAIAGSSLPVLLPDVQGPHVLPIMLACGVAGGAAFALIPAVLKVRFATNEILVSLMLVYVSELFLDWLVRGPWRNPEGFNFPETRQFHAWATMPVIGDSRLNVGAIFTVVVCLLLAFVLSRTYLGFGARLSGTAPLAARFAGISRDRVVILVMAVSGGLAGLAGVMEVAGPIGQLRTQISPGYGFTAIIVAFLARLNPAGAILAGFVLSVTYIGGEAAQIAIGISDKITRVFQGALLLFVLASDVFLRYRIRFAVRLSEPLEPAAEKAGRMSS